MTSYNNTVSQGFNKHITCPYGYVEFKFSFGEGDNKCSVESLFMVILCKSIYNCILGRPTIASLYVVTSTVHLKMRYHNNKGEVITIHGELGGANI